MQYRLKEGIYFPNDIEKKKEEHLNLAYTVPRLESLLIFRRNR